MHIDHERRQLRLKIVYCGPGLAGKSTNLARIHALAPAGTASELASEEAHSERTLHFHQECTGLGPVQGLGVQAEFWTIPGQSYYAATRRRLLEGADGVVFVADSRREALDENIAAMNDMFADLRHHGLPQDLPLVLQYNRQDAPTALPRAQLEPLMNVRSWPSFPAVASEGRGVEETVAEVLRLAVAQARLADLPDPGRRASWMLACYRCQAMLEVPTAVPGEIYTCGVCGSRLEVADPERGLTRAAPEPVRPPTAAHVRQADPTGAQQALVHEGPVTALEPRSSPPPVPGEEPFQVPGYSLVAELDASPLGRRSRVRELATGRTLRALAVDPGLLAQPGYAETLADTVRRAGQLRHPNLLPQAGAWLQPGTAVLFSADPPDHEPLAQVLARRRALAPPHAVGLLRQLVLALDEAARSGLHHGWLRPEGILVSGDGNLLLDDLAVPVVHRLLVRELASDSAATDYGLAPELIAEGARADAASGMFMLGGLLFRMMTGEGLITGYGAYEALHRVAVEGTRPLREAMPGVSRDLGQFHQRLVEIDPQRRYRDYRELIEHLDRFGGGARRQALQLTAPAVRTPAAGQPVAAGPGAAPHRPAAPGGPRLPAGVRPRPGVPAGGAPPGPGAATATRTPPRRADAVGRPSPPEGGFPWWWIAAGLLAAAALAAAVGVMGGTARPAPSQSSATP